MLLKIIFLALLFPIFGNSQTKSNLDLFFTLIDNAKTELKKDFPNNQIIFEQDIRNQYSVLYNRFLLNDSLYKIGDKIIIKIDTAITEYPSIFRDGILGDFFLERKVKLKISSSSKMNYVKDFSYADSVEISRINFIEDNYLSFTKNEFPTEPFWASFVQPISIALFSITTIFLLFFIRS